jgi:hypothetical protein
MAEGSHELEAFSRSLSDLSAQLRKTHDAGTRRELLKQVRLLLDKVDKIVVNDLREK